MKNEKRLKAELISKKDFADKNWEKIKIEVLIEKKIEKSRIVEGMHLCNKADLALIQMGKKL